MNRRGFMKGLLSGLLGMGSLVIGNRLHGTDDQRHGKGKKCRRSVAVHELRSPHPHPEDLSGTRCPRCTLRMLERITEAQMAEALKRLGA